LADRQICVKKLLIAARTGQQQAFAGKAGNIGSDQDYPVRVDLDGSDVRERRTPTALTKLTNAQGLNN
jgi:hypothetical protein